MSKYFLLFYLFTQAQSLVKANTLWDEKNVYYTIIASKSTLAETNAVHFLQKVLEIQSGKSWAGSAKYLQLQKKPLYITQLNNSQIGITNPGYEIVINSNEIVLKADSGNLIFCAAQFLERFTKCRSFSDTVTIYPKFRSLLLPENFSKLYHSYFNTRLLYERSAFNEAFIKWHGLSNKSGPIRNEYSFGWGLWAHTFFTLVPPQEYYKMHPEYFSLVDGKRVAEQLCLSDKAIVNIAIQNLKTLIVKKPDIKYWSVSQMDNEHFCQCENCSRINNEEASNSGTIIRFVNEIAKQFPDKIITTLAYQYSRKAPKLTKPVSNVTITLCSLESDRSKPLEVESGIQTFSSDLKSWFKITPNVMVWDYTINFQNIPAPFPNLHVLQPNIIYFKNSGVKTIFEHGWQVGGGGLQEYRTYLLCKLLNDPFINADSIKVEFFNGYYGNGGQFLIKVIDRMQQQFINSNLPLSIFEGLSPHKDGYLSENNRAVYKNLIADALRATTAQPEIFKRVDAFAQAFRFCDVELNSNIIGTKKWIDSFSTTDKMQFKKNNRDLLNEFVNKSYKLGLTTINETTISVDQYKQSTAQKFLDNVEDNIAIGGNITFETPYLSTFKGLGDNTLIDGSLGTDDWSRTWQGWGNTNIVINLILKQTTLLSEFKMRFMKDSTNNLVIPEYIKLYTSFNNQKYTLIATSYPSVPKIDKPTDIINFSVNLKTLVNTKFVKILIQWPGYKHKNGLQYGSYMFSDEAYFH